MNIEMYHRYIEKERKYFHMSNFPLSCCRPLFGIFGESSFRKWLSHRPHQPPHPLQSLSLSPETQCGGKEAGRQAGVVGETHQRAGSCRPVSGNIIKSQAGARPISAFRSSKGSGFLNESSLLQNWASIHLHYGGQFTC